MGSASRWWLHHALECLSEELKSCGLSLTIRSGNPAEVLSSIAKKTGAKRVFWNRCYEPSAIALDQKVKKALNLLEVKTFNTSLLYEPWVLPKAYRVFTPFWKACLKMETPSKPLPKPTQLIPFQGKIKTETIASLALLPKVPWAVGIRNFWSPGTASAKKLLKQFIEKKIELYPSDRDFPGVDGTSLLSPYLHFGEITPRMIWHEVSKKKPKNAEVFLRQLGWREFAHHLLFHFPHTPEKPLYEKFSSFPWRKNKKELQAWQKGMTGFPFIDAGMRQLWKVGWMHNRLRMVVGSFLVKDLLLPWQEGAKWFWDTLVDADLANNTLGWQWVGGCGADAAPYFRVFNPVLQGERFDPKGEFVRLFVPELAALPDKWIHHPWDAPEGVLEEAGVILGDTYPFPIVEHSEARKRALAALEKIK